MFKTLKLMMQILAGAVLGSAALVLCSCSSPPKVQKATAMAYREGVPGGTVVENYNITVTVASLDLAQRKVTLKAPDGTQNTFIAGRDVEGLEKLRPGDAVRVAVTRELVIYLSKDSRPVLPEEKPLPGALRADTVNKTAWVKTVDEKRRTVLLQFADNTSQSFTLRKDIDTRQLKPGDEVLIGIGSSVVLLSN